MRASAQLQLLIVNVRIGLPVQPVDQPPCQAAPLKNASLRKIGIAILPMPACNCGLGTRTCTAFQIVPEESDLAFSWHGGPTGSSTFSRPVGAKVQALRKFYSAAFQHGLLRLLEGKRTVPII